MAVQIKRPLDTSILGGDLQYDVRVRLHIYETWYEIGLGANSSVPLFQQIVATRKVVFIEGAFMKHMTLPCWWFHQTVYRSSTDLWNYLLQLVKDFNNC